jgi:nucleotide-binding universal stress UspA family protein
MDGSALFESATRGRSLNASWHLPRGGMVERVCKQARYADLIIVGREPTEIAAERSPLSLADELVLKSGRPVLLLPDVEMPVAPPKRALIAWDGSREAVRAVHDALPLLEQADVSLVLVANPEPEQIDDDVAREDELLDHLGRHKVVANAATTLRLDRPEADVILGYLKEHGVDLLVMGGFGHWAWRELLFGGTTAGLMRKAPVPILISH